MAPSLASHCSCSGRRTEAEWAFQPKALAAGQEGTLGYRVHFVDQKGAAISPWHSIPLFAEKGLLNMVCEIPRGTRAKFEVSTGEAGNPVKQDVKKGKLRSYGIDMKWNYGMFPQTWEDPAHASADCGGFVGDNDPVDVVEIGNHDPKSGAVYSVKPIAALAMIDEGELDWKVVAIASSDPRVDLVNDVQDVEAHFSGELDAIREWFRTYKTHEGKPLNQFELNEQYAGREYTMDVIGQTHGFWKALVEKARSGEGTGKVTVGDVPIITACFDDATRERLEDAGTEVEDTVKSLLEAMKLEEKSAKTVEGHVGMHSAAMLGA